MTIPFRTTPRGAAAAGCAFSLRIDERQRAEMARRPPASPRSRRGGGSTVREDKEFRRILIFPPAREPAEGRRRPDSQGILIFPSDGRPDSRR